MTDIEKLIAIVKAGNCIKALKIIAEEEEVCPCSLNTSEGNCLHSSGRRAKEKLLTYTQEELFEALL